MILFQIIHAAIRVHILTLKILMEKMTQFHFQTHAMSSFSNWFECFDPIRLRLKFYTF